MWLAQEPTAELRVQAEHAAERLGLPLEVRETGDTGLEQALERQPDREDLARKLRAAYLETGQMARAAELQRNHALDA